MAPYRSPVEILLAAFADCGGKKRGERQVWVPAGVNKAGNPVPALVIGIVVGSDDGWALSVTDEDGRANPGDVSWARKRIGRADPAFERGLGDALAMLVLRTDDPGRWQSLRDKFKEIRGVSLRIVDQKLNRLAAWLAQAEAAAQQADGLSDAGDGRVSQADRLIQLVAPGTLFVGLQEEAASANSASGDVYVMMTVETHREIWPLRSSTFRHWLVQSYLAMNHKSPNSDAIKQAIDTLDALGRRPESLRCVVHLRVARVDNAIWIDLCDERWRALRVTSASWELVETPPVYFRRTEGMLALPEPVAVGPVSGQALDGDLFSAPRLAVLARLRALVNLRQGDEGDRDFVLAWCWLLMSLSGRTSFPVLALFGEHNTAKSSFMTLWRSLSDPHVMVTRSPPRDDDMLRTAMFNSYMLSFDNLSSIPQWLSELTLPDCDGRGRRQTRALREPCRGDRKGLPTDHADGHHQRHHAR